VSLPTALPRTAMQRRWTHYASPSTFYVLAGRMLPWCWAIAAVAAVAGLVVGLLVAPTDAQQGDAYRIIFVHVPAAWMSMIIYLAMAFWAAVGLVFNTRLSSMMARALAPTGALMTLAGAVDRRPVGQADLGHVVGMGRAPHVRAAAAVPVPGLHGAASRARRSAPWPTGSAPCWRIVGVVNVPVIYFSVRWWNTLHQGASVSLTQAPSMARVMLAGMLLMAVAFWAWSIGAALHRLRTIVLVRERGADWVAALPELRRP
jgi:heme exporter protein C